MLSKLLRKKMEKEMERSEVLEVVVENERE